ncbi:putative cytokinetic ring protein SteA [Paenibacillus swuensis]|uniref:putative cytokinetic ring protein SteA n=1 Tax=Paenibacillus swuensis TaxID=1178515 RepID=UPI0018D31111
MEKLKPGDIALLLHNNLDELSASGLIHAGVKAVVNCGVTMNGHYPAEGPRMLIHAGIPIYQGDQDLFVTLAKQEAEQAVQGKQGVEIRICEGVLHCGEHTAKVSLFTERDWHELYMEGQAKLPDTLNAFITNTLVHASNESVQWLEPMSLPALRSLSGRYALIVVRGSGYKEDLSALQAFINEYEPALIGVDGGADALLEAGYMPDLIVGDMDSVSDGALCCGCELVVHAYPDGRAPGLKRVHELGLPVQIIPAHGTSEDVALLTAYELGAERIIAVGSHTSMIDFLEKGRKGMASTLLVRMKIGSKLIDAKGFALLYTARSHKRRSEVAKAWLRTLASAGLAAGMLIAVAACWSPLYAQAPSHHRESEQHAPVSAPATGHTHSTDQKEIWHVTYRIRHHSGVE